MTGELAEALQQSSHACQEVDSLRMRLAETLEAAAAVSVAASTGRHHTVHCTHTYLLCCWICDFIWVL